MYHRGRGIQGQGRYNEASKPQNKRIPRHIYLDHKDTKEGNIKVPSYVIINREEQCDAHYPTQQHANSVHHPAKESILESFVSNSWSLRNKNIVVVGVSMFNHKLF